MIVKSINSDFLTIARKGSFFLGYGREEGFAYTFSLSICYCNGVKVSYADGNKMTFTEGNDFLFLNCQQNVDDYAALEKVANAILTTTDRTAVGELESEKRY